VSKLYESMTERNQQNKKWRIQEKQKKEIEELKKCTFKPKIIDKNKFLLRKNHKHNENETEKSQNRSDLRRMRPASQNRINSGYKKYNSEMRESKSMSKI